MILAKDIATAGVYWMANEGEGYGWFMTVSPSYYPNTRAATAKEITAENIASILDQDAENENYHELVGAYKWLAQVVTRCAGSTNALSVLHEIAQAGGLMKRRDTDV